MNIYSDPFNILGIFNNKGVIIYITIFITGNNLMAIYSLNWSVRRLDSSNRSSLKNWK